MNWKKKTLLALLAATALVGVAASASAEDWNFFGDWSTPSTYASHNDGDRGDHDAYRGQYADRDYRHQNRDWAYRHDDNNSNWGYGGYNRAYDGGERYHSWNRGYDNGYVQQDRGYRSYGEHRDRDESDDDD